MKFNTIFLEVQAYSLLLAGSRNALVTQAQRNQDSSIYSPSSSPPSTLKLTGKVVEKASQIDPLNVQSSRPSKYLRNGDNVHQASNSVGLTKKKVKVIITGDPMMPNNSTFSKVKDGNSVNFSGGTSRDANFGYKVKGAKISVLTPSEDSSIASKTHDNPFNIPQPKSLTNDTEITISPSPAQAGKGKKGTSIERGLTLPPHVQKKANDFNLTESIQTPSPSKILKKSIENLQKVLKIMTV
jgi:hypothetical protein